MFEVGVLAAGLGSVLAFFLVSRLYPGKTASPLFDSVTDDRFVVVLQASNQGFNESRAVKICRLHEAESWTLIDPPITAPRRPLVAMRWLQ